MLSPRLQLFNGTNLIFVDAGVFAVQLFELVEARGIIVLGGVDCLDFTAVVECDHRWLRTAGKGGQASSEHKGRESPVSHGVSPTNECAFIDNCP